MTKMIKLGTACDFTGLRQFDFYITDREIIAQAKESVREAYREFKEERKGGEADKIRK